MIDMLANFFFQSAKQHLKESCLRQDLHRKLFLSRESILEHFYETIVLTSARMVVAQAGHEDSVDPQVAHSRK